MRISRKLGRNITLALLGTGTVAFSSGMLLADQFAITADQLVAGVPELRFGDVCAGGAVSKPVRLDVVRSATVSSFANSARINFTATVAAPLSVDPIAAVTTPAGWALSQSGTTLSTTATINVPDTAAVGPISTVANVTASGLRAGGGTLSMVRGVRVVANVISCDVTPPVVTVPSTIVAEAQSSVGAAVSFNASAVDVAPAAPPVSCSPASASTFAIGTTNVVCTAVDDAGNVGSAAFDVMVVDTTAPVIAGTPSDLVVEAIDASGATIAYSAPTASDLVDGDVPVSCNPAAGATFAIGATTVDCSATDAAGNGSSAAFSVVVQDTTQPVIVTPAPLTAEATGPAGAAVGYDVSAVDSVSGALTAACDPAAGSMFPIGPTSVACVATDAAGNSASAAFDVVVVDTTAPVIAAGADVTVAAVDAAGATASFAPTASDVVDGAVAVSCSPASGSVFPVGTTAVACSATDAAGNSAAATINVTVADVTAPALSLPVDVRAEAASPAGRAVDYSATAADAVDGGVAVACSHPSGSTFPIGSTSVMCSAVDAAGNQSSGAFTVEVVDAGGPVVTVPADMTIEATASNGSAATFSASASDAVDGPLPVSCTPASGSTFALGTTSVSCQASDSNGHVGHAVFNVHVVDTTAPSLVVPASIAVGAKGLLGAVVEFETSASDLVDGGLRPVCNPASGSTFPSGSTSVACTAVDAAGNSTSASFVVSVGFRLKGFAEPVDMKRVNKVEAGARVPLKFSVRTADGLYVVTPDIVDSLTIVSKRTGAVTKLPVCSAKHERRCVEVGTTQSGRRLRIDWRAPQAPGTYVVTMTLDGGESLTATFEVRGR